MAIILPNYEVETKGEPIFYHNNKYWIVDPTINPGNIGQMPNKYFTEDYKILEL